MENKYSFGEQDVEYFGAKLQTKQDRDQVNERPKADEEEEGADKSYVDQTQYNQDDLDKIDMHSLNLFGIPLDDISGKESLKDIAGSNAETQKVLRELIDLTEQIGGSSISNFGIRKSFVYYDPYEPEESVTYAYLKFEDQQKLRASVVLDLYKKEVAALKDDDLTYADKERKDQVLKLIDYLGQLKVVDASILFKLYDLYRYKV